MAKPKTSFTAQMHREPICKTTRQGHGRGSKANHGRKQPVGQGKR
jgi:hypothetical protein